MNNIITLNNSNNIIFNYRNELLNIFFKVVLTYSKRKIDSSIWKRNSLLVFKIQNLAFFQKLENLLGLLRKCFFLCVNSMVSTFDLRVVSFKSLESKNYVLYE